MGMFDPYASRVHTCFEHTSGSLYRGIFEKKQRGNGENRENRCNKFNFYVDTP